MVGCPAHSADANRPGTTRDGFGGLTLGLSLGGEFSEARSWCCYVCVCWRRTPQPLLQQGFLQALRQPPWGTQITYADSRSCGPIFLKYENKGDRLRAGFDRQAGGARSFAGSASREDQGHG